MADKKVLLVDDETHIINVMSLKLKNAGFEVFTATNGEEALKRFDETFPDLVVSDFSMPVMNGVEFVKNLRGREKGKELPVIMLTARGQTVEEEDEPDLKISVLLSKPFSPREVLFHVQTLLKEE